jgi:hypothetical protein
VPVAKDEDFESRIDKIKREIRDRREEEGHQNQIFSHGCRGLLKEIQSLFERTVNKLRHDDELADAKWGAENEDDVHLSARSRRTSRIYILRYRCYWPDQRVQRITTIQGLASGNYANKRQQDFALGQLDGRVLEDHVEDFLRLAFTGRDFI